MEYVVVCSRDEVKLVRSVLAVVNRQAADNELELDSELVAQRLVQALDRGERQVHRLTALTLGAEVASEFRLN